MEGGLVDYPLSLSCLIPADLLAPAIRNRLTTTQRTYRLWAGECVCVHVYSSVIVWVCKRAYILFLPDDVTPSPDDVMSHVLSFQLTPLITLKL